MAKYKVQVFIQSTASKLIGEVECDSLEEFNQKAEKLWDSQENDYPTENITNDFDLGDWDISELREDDLKFFKIT